MSVCFASCVNYWEAMSVSKKFHREYTGIDTLISIDGYYYFEDSTGLNTPIIISKDGGFKIYQFGYFNTQEELQNVINRFGYSKGSYTLVDDTIKIKWAFLFDLMSYYITSEKYVVENDTTLRLVWRACERCQTSDGKKRASASNIRNDIYKFYPYSIDKK